MAITSVTHEMIAFLVGCFVVSSIAFLAFRARREANKYRRRMHHENAERGDVALESYVDSEMFKDIK